MNISLKHQHIILFWLSNNHGRFLIDIRNVITKHERYKKCISNCMKQLSYSSIKIRVASPTMLL